MNPRWRRWVGIALGILAFLGVDFLLLPPRGTFALSEPVYWLLLPLFMMGSAALARSYERRRLRVQHERELAAKDAVLATLSHDLRTPLTTIRALAHDLAVEGDDRAQLIEEEAERLTILVSDMLELARFQGGAPLMNPQPNEAEDLIGVALQRVAGAAQGRTINVSLHEGEPLLFGQFDFTQTLRALVNLIENALKYSPAGAPVDIRVRREMQWLAFSVLDKGSGISDADRERIFEPFYRGLGLSIAHAVAVAQGGSLTYQSRQGGGSIFTLRVPAIDVADVSS